MAAKSSTSKATSVKPLPPAIRRANRQLGEDVKTWRKLRSLTQTQLADRAGISRGVLSRPRKRRRGSLARELPAGTPRPRRAGEPDPRPRSLRIGCRQAAVRRRAAQTHPPLRADVLEPCRPRRSKSSFRSPARTCSPAASGPTDAGRRNRRPSPTRRPTWRGKTRTPSIRPSRSSPGRSRPRADVRCSEPSPTAPRTAGAGCSSSGAPVAREAAPARSPRKASARSTTCSACATTSVKALCASAIRSSPSSSPMTPPGFPTWWTCRSF